MSNDHHIMNTNVFEAEFKSTRKPTELKPTYPLDVENVRKLQELVVCDSPKLLAWQLLAQLGSRFSLLSRFSETWSQIEPKLSDAVVEHVVKQSNIAQDQVVRCLIDVLRDQNRDEYAKTLTRFLRSKQRIELALKTNRSLAPQRADVETIVDSIMQEVCNEIFMLADMDSNLNEWMTNDGTMDQIARLKTKIETSKERISRAYDTLKETEKQTTHNQPAQSPETDEQTATITESVILDKLIDALHDENNIAKTVNDRKEQELPG